MGDIKTGLNMIRKPDGCKVVVSFNTLPTGANNWEMCKTERIEFKDCSANGEMCMHFDNTKNAVALQIGYIYILVCLAVVGPYLVYDNFCFGIWDLPGLGLYHVTRTFFPIFLGGICVI